MSVLRAFEEKVIDLLTKRVLSPEILAEVKQGAEVVSYNYTGHGYYLKLRHPKLPQERVVCDRPVLKGVTEGLETGFLVFLQNHELTLECFPYGPDPVPEHYRERNVEVTAT